MLVLSTVSLYACSLHGSLNVCTLRGSLNACSLHGFSKCLFSPRFSKCLYSPRFSKCLFSLRFSLHVCFILYACSFQACSFILLHVSLANNVYITLVPSILVSSLYILLNFVHSPLNLRTIFNKCGMYSDCTHFIFQQLSHLHSRRYKCGDTSVGDEFYSYIALQKFIPYILVYIDYLRSV
jgi:hypothetical protein